MLPSLNHSLTFSVSSYVFPSWYLQSLTSLMIFVLSLFPTQMVTNTHRRTTAFDGYDAEYYKFYDWIPVRYKTRQQVGPKSDCIGIDMNRSVSFFAFQLSEVALHCYAGIGCASLVYACHTVWRCEQGYKWKAPRRRGSGPADLCSHWSPGHRPFEALEVNNIANLVTTIPNFVRVSRLSELWTNLHVLRQFQSQSCYFSLRHCPLLIFCFVLYVIISNLGRSRLLHCSSSHTLTLSNVLL